MDCDVIVHVIYTFTTKNCVCARDRQTYFRTIVKQF